MAAEGTEGYFLAAELAAERAAFEPEEPMVGYDVVVLAEWGRLKNYPGLASQLDLAA